MRVMEIREYGAPEMLVKAERPDPSVPGSGSGEVLIRVKAAGINRPDVLQRKGHSPFLQAHRISLALKLLERLLGVT